MIDHFLAQIDKSSFKNKISPSHFQSFIHLPQRLFPTSFSIETEDYWCGGYLASYSGELSPKKMAKVCQAEDWPVFSENTDDYLVLFYSKPKNKLRLLVGQSGAFPCYFAMRQNQFIASTDFYEVKKRINRLTLNVDSAIEYLFTEYAGLFTDETIVSEINQLPSGCLLTLSEDFSWKVTSLVDLDKFRDCRPPHYTSLKNFADDFVTLFEKVTQERLSLVQNYSWASDLSSGFDIALVCHALKKVSDKPFTCFSRLTNISPGDAVPEVMEEFVKKHGFYLKTLKTEKLFPFSTQKGLDWTATHFFPAIHGLEYYGAYVHFVAQNGYQIIFGGNGGDEIYSSHQIDNLGRFPIQAEYFLTVNTLKEGLNELFTSQGLDLLISKDRFTKRPYYPSILSTSTTVVRRLYFPIYWEEKVWPIDPYCDLRLVQLARGIPLKNGKPPTKHELWQHRSDIFVPSQFRPKEHMADHVGQYITKEKEFIIALLKDSILGELGLVRSSEIIDNLRKGKERIYQDKLVVLFHNILRLEYFLQRNKVKIS